MLTDGMMFGQYRIEKKIGSGGMGAVYKATDTLKGRTVAIKVIHPHIAEIEQFIKRFHQEAKLLEKLAHPKVVRVYDSGVVDGHHYIVMEFISGRNLTDIMRERSIKTAEDTTTATRFEPLPEEFVLRIMEQMARVLQEAAELGVIHRDIKPDNLVVTDIERLDIKLLDFGIAKDTAELHTVLSQTGQVMGTPAYMSPEQCEGKKLDIRSDLYSLGVMAYQCASGRLPFEGPTTMAYIKQHLLEHPKPLSELNPKLSTGLVAMIHKLLAKSPDERYQTPLDLLEDLNRIRRGELPRFASEAVTGMEELTPPAATFGSLETPTIPAKRITITTAQRRLPNRIAVLSIIGAIALIASLGYYFGVLNRKKHDTLPPPPQKRAPMVKREERRSPIQEVMERVKKILNNAGVKELPSVIRHLNIKKGRLKRMLKEAAKDAENRKDWEKAEALYDELSRIGGMGETADALMRVRRERKYIELLKDAEKAFGESDYDTAEKLAEEAAELFNREEVRMLLNAIETKKRCMEKLKNWDEMVKAGDAAMANGDWETAVYAYRMALNIRSDADVDRKLRRVKKELEYKKKMTEAERLIEERNYKDAALLFNEAKLLFKRREAVNGSSFATLATAGIEAFRKGDYQRAETYFSNALQYQENRYIRQMLTLSKAHEGDWWRMLERRKKELRSGRSAVVGFAPSDNGLVSVNADGTVRVFDSSGKETASVLIKGCTPTSFAVRKNLFVVGTNTGYLFVGEWSVREVEQKRSILAHKSWVRAVEFVTDTTVVSAGYDGKICVVDIENNKIKKRIDAGSGWIYDIRPIDTSHIAVASADRTVKVWNISDGACKKSLSGHKGVVWGLSEPSNGRIASVANDKTLCLWDLKKEHLIRRVELGVSVYAVVMDAEARIGVCGTDNGLIMVDMMQKKVLREEMLGSKVKNLYIFDHNFTVLCGTEDGRVVTFSLSDE